MRCWLKRARFMPVAAMGQSLGATPSSALKDEALKLLGQMIEVYKGKA
jgi:hypothetical protein